MDGLNIHGWSQTQSIEEPARTETLLKSRRKFLMSLFEGSLVTKQFLSPAGLAKVENDHTQDRSMVSKQDIKTCQLRNTSPAKLVFIKCIGPKAKNSYSTLVTKKLNIWERAQQPYILGNYISIFFVVLRSPLVKVSPLLGGLSQLSLLRVFYTRRG